MLKNSIVRVFSGLSKLNHVNRFYKNVNVERIEPGKYAVLLDHRKIKTPDNHPYYLPTEALAHVVALEFDIQKVYIKTSSMPVVLQMLI